MIQLPKNIDEARLLDKQDPMSKFRSEFAIPKETPLYFAGHSLGLMPKKARTYINEELDAWEEYGVEGHFHGKRPWLPYHELMSESFAKLMGAKSSEVVAMNSLTVNLHLMLVSFYRPTKSRYKILIENNTFPSDKYAVDSQARFHGFDPKDTVVELRPRQGEYAVRPEDIEAQIKELGDSLALIMLGNCNYLSGQRFDTQAITELGHAQGAMVGFNLAHGAGNLATKLNSDNVDFAVWCSYKYINSGAGGMAGAFVHERHHKDKEIPRFEGWWGTNKQTRFKMGPTFDAIESAEAWQLSNPPIFQLAALRASLDLFDEAGIENLRARGDKLTSCLEGLLLRDCSDLVSIMTPKERGSMLCVRVKGDAQAVLKALQDKGAILDFRQPDILRMTPAPLYNSYEDIYQLVQVIAENIK